MPEAEGRSIARRALAILGLLGAVIAVVAVAMFGTAGELGSVAVLAVLAALIVAVVLPAGQAIGRGVATPSAVPDRDRAGALVAGVAGLALSVLVLSAHAGWSLITGALLGATSAVAASIALRAPRPRSWRPSDASLGALVLLLVLLMVLPKLEGPKPHAYYLNMQRALREIATMQAAVRADSGHYSRDLDTSSLYEVRTLRATGTLVLRATADGYGAWTSSTLTPGRCAVFMGTAPVAPATVPGVVACTPYPDTLSATIGTIWLASLLVTAGASFWFRPRGSSASA